MPFLLFVNFFVIIVLCLLRYNDTRTSEGVWAVNKGDITCIIDSHYEFLFLNYIHSVFLHIVPRVWETVIFYPRSAKVLRQVEVKAVINCKLKFELESLFTT